MNKIYKIILITLNFILILSIEVFAKHNYTFEINAYHLKRDNSKITYTLSRTGNENEYTNKDVILTINLNKPVYKIDGFAISEDKKTLKKVIKENETNTITVEDISGNTQNITYNINNIDKIPPQIIGVENGKTYNSDVQLKFIDNIGIKDIKIDKYSKLGTTVNDDYYDVTNYKGTDLTDCSAKVKLTGHPKNTKTYKYYINNIFKAHTTATEYTFTGLKKGTLYTIKIEAIDINGKVLETVTRNVKTKMFSNITSTKDNLGNFTVTLSGIDSSIDNAVAVGYTKLENQITSYPSITSDRTVTVTFSAKSITGNLQNGYYYFHIQLYDDGKVVDTACCNVIFEQNSTVQDISIKSQDLYKLTSNGNYQIIVTDLAGNKTEKFISINK